MDIPMQLVSPMMQQTSGFDQAPPQVAQPSLPTQHFITAALNGTILGSTDTITGYLPSQLLMKTIYDGIHHEDLAGFKAVQTYFWNKGNHETQIYIRRRTVQGEWVWVVSKVASYMGDPVAGMIIFESRVENEEKAKTFSRITRIMTLLNQGMEDASKYAAANEASPNIINGQKQGNDSLILGDIPGLADDAAVLQQLLESSNDPSVALLQLVESAKVGGVVDSNSSDSGNGSAGSDNQSPGSAVKPNDTPSILNLVSSGVNINLGKVRLSRLELKMVIMVLKGHVTVENLSAFIFSQIDAPEKVLSVVEGFTLQKKKRRSRRHNSSLNPLSLQSSSQQSLLNAMHRLNSRHNSIFKSSNSASDLHHAQVRVDDSSSSHDNNLAHDPRIAPLHITVKPQSPPNIAVINLSFTEIGNKGIKMFCGYISSDTPSLKTLDLSFCNLEERGILALCQALRKRKDKGYLTIHGLILTGNVVSYKAAKEIGSTLSKTDKKRKCHKIPVRDRAGYDEDDEFDVGDYEDDFDDDDDILPGNGKRSRQEKLKSAKKSKKEKGNPNAKTKGDPGIQLLHMGSASLSSEALYQLVVGLGPDCNIRELNISSNNIGADGISLFLEYLEGTGLQRSARGKKVMPKLDRLDISNNNLGNNGVAKIARAISKRTHLSMVDFHLSFNNICPGGTGTLMNKLLQHNLQTLSLDNNVIGDEGCQLVAASLSCMHHLSKLNLSFNQIGSRGITSLMKAIVGCETLTHLGLSGNVMKISGAIAMGFALAQHPRLSCLDLDNCCLSQVAQCHIVAGIISNRWVPMQKMKGFQAGPPMVAIGALGDIGQYLCNEKCFTARRNMQMETILKWMSTKKKEVTNENQNPSASNLESNRNTSEGNFLTVDYVSTSTDETGPPSQSAYTRMLDWLSRIPFDEEELNDLRYYFYDADDGKDGMRESQGRINLKQRGDLLAALGSEADKLREENNPFIFDPNAPPVGLSLEGDDEPETDLSRFWGLNQVQKDDGKVDSSLPAIDESQHSQNSQTMDTDATEVSNSRKRQSNELSSDHGMKRSSSSMSKQSLCDSERSTTSRESKRQTQSARITKFPHFLAKLDLLKANAQEMMDKETVTGQQDIIAQQFAEASLTLLRQLRYHCMNSGLDGWRQGNMKRKVLIIDDSLVTRKLIARSFEKANFVVDTAENGELGVEMMKKSIYDIAFMDIEMPVMNGFDATKALRDWEDIERPGARQPICALTAAYVDDFEREELMKFKDAGLDVMESKPCNIPRLFKVVDDVSPLFSDLSISITQQMHSTATLG